MRTIALAGPLLLLIAACGGGSSEAPPSDSPADGFYVVLEESRETAVPVEAEEGRWVRGPSIDPGLRWLRLTREPGALLTLAAAPVPVELEGDGPAFEGRLVEEEGERFARLTEESIGGRIAVVLFGRVAIAPRVMATIRGGRFRVVFPSTEERDAAIARLRR